ncbi:MAG: LCP family protein [Lachnospiraceae bacterium]|nr:LCP family protein [Lachnospiraceae bacterium]
MKIKTASFARIGRMALITVCAIMMVLCGSISGRLMHAQAQESESETADEMLASADEADAEESSATADEVDAEETSALADEADAEESSATADEAETEEDGSSAVVSLPGNDGIYSILLIGSDRREDNWNGNSDVMIVVTVNSNTQRIIMTSYMRDLYADIPGYGVHKLNYAYAAAGADKLIETLEESYEIEIDNYAAVDFDAMAEIIDLIGGVDIELSDDEVEVLNSYLSEEDKDQALESGGEYHLNGVQAVAYMRIRYVGNADYQRTQRQRTVLSDIFDTAKEMTAAELAELAEEILELTDHDISALDMIQLISSLSGLTEYELVENRVPYDGLYTSQNEMLVPDFDATIEKLHEVLYGDGEEEAADE